MERPLWCRWNGRDDHLRLGHGRAVNQLLEAAVGHNISGIETGCHHGVALIRDSGFHRPHHGLAGGLIAAAISAVPYFSVAAAACVVSSTLGTVGLAARPARSTGRESLNEIHVVDSTVVLDGRRRDKNLIVQSFYQEAGVDELIRVKISLGVVELRAQLNGSRCGIDLVVDRDQAPFGDKVCIGAIEGLHRKRFAGPHLLQNLLQAVLG